MPDPKAVLLAALDAVEAGRFEYLLYGGMAAALWGEPRYTEDADMILFLPERDAPRFLQEAARHGFFVEEDLAIQQIQINGWARLPLGSADSPWHLDLTLGDSPFDQSAVQRRRCVALFGRNVWVASPEDLIVYKLVSGRDVDLLDVQHIAERQERLDSGYLRTWARWWEEQGVREIQRRVEALIVPS